MGEILSVALLFSTIRFARRSSLRRSAAFFPNVPASLTSRSKVLCWQVHLRRRLSLTKLRIRIWVSPSGLVAGAVLALVYAVSVIKFEADQVVAGFGINILMLGLPALFHRRFTIRPVRRSRSTRNFCCRYFFDVSLSRRFWRSRSIPVCWYVFYKTPFGLRLRAVGENPAAADAAGVSVVNLRYTAVILRAFWLLRAARIFRSVRVRFSHGE